MARPSKYKPEFAEQARKLSDLGLTDEQMSSFFDVTIKTFNNWKGQYPEFLQSLKIGKDQPDENVKRSLYQRAIGYSHQDVDIRVVEGQIVETPIIKHYPPDTTAAIFWLKNRLPDEFREKKEQEGETDLSDVLSKLIDKLPS